jgi:ribosome-associated protein
MQPANADQNNTVTILGEMIRLGAFLKLSGIAESGGAAKALLGDGEVFVNGEPEQRRGRQLHPGDVVQVGDERLLVAARPA